MRDPADLQRAIRDKLNVQQRHTREERRVLAEQMAEREQQQAQFERIADELSHTVIDPRFETLADIFPNAELSPVSNENGIRYDCRFQSTAEYPATVHLSLEISHDEQFDNILLTYNLEILPVFLRFEGHQQAMFPVSAVDPAAVADWVDQRILEFVNTYLQVAESDQYQRETLVIDPVCGMTIRRSVAEAKETLAGKTYYFCADTCHAKFLETPERYVASFKP